jgi:hypothetical protein
MSEHPLSLLQALPTPFQFPLQLSQRIFIVALKNGSDFFLVRLAHSKGKFQHYFHRLIVLWVATHEEVSAGLFEVIFDDLGYGGDEGDVLAVEIGRVFLEDVQLLDLFLLLAREDQLVPW